MTGKWTNPNIILINCCFLMPTVLIQKKICELLNVVRLVGVVNTQILLHINIQLTKLSEYTGVINQNVH